MRGITVTVTRQSTQSGEDSQGNPTYTTETIAVDGCAWAPGASGDDVVSFGGRAITGGTIYVPKKTFIFLPTDVVTVEGNNYSVDGETGVWRSPFTGRIRGVEVAVKRGA